MAALNAEKTFTQGHKHNLSSFKMENSKRNWDWRTTKEMNGACIILPLCRWVTLGYISMCLPRAEVKILPSEESQNGLGWRGP